MKNYVMALSVWLMGYTAFANPVLDQFRATWAGSIPQQTTALDVGTKLTEPVYPDAQDESLISVRACQEIANKIKANYRVDPFNQQIDRGSVYFAICDSDTIGVQADHIHFQQASLKSQMGLQSAYLLREGVSHSNFGTGVVSLLLDHDFKIIEISETATNMSLAPWFTYVGDLDQNGNVYSNLVYFDQKNAGHLINGPLAIAHAQAFDGSNSGITRWTWRDTGNPSHVMVRNFFQRADKKDWDRFDAPLTYGNQEGLYSYGSTLETSPKNASWLEVDTLDGIETCAEGIQVVAGQYQPYMLEESSPSGCNP